MNATSKHAKATKEPMVLELLTLVNKKIKSQDHCTRGRTQTWQQYYQFLWQCSYQHWLNILEMTACDDSHRKSCMASFQRNAHHTESTSTISHNSNDPQSWAVHSCNGTAVGLVLAPVPSALGTVTLAKVLAVCIAAKVPDLGRSARRGKRSWVDHGGWTHWLRWLMANRWWTETMVNGWGLVNQVAQWLMS